MSKKVTFEEVCDHLAKNYGSSCISRLYTNSGYIVPKTYVHYSSNTIFTRDKELAERKGYKYFEL